ncbi:unnamed protein product [Rotaria socialis]
MIDKCQNYFEVLISFYRRSHFVFNVNKKSYDFYFRQFLLKKRAPKFPKIQAAQRGKTLPLNTEYFRISDCPITLIIMSQLMSECEMCQQEYTLFRRKKECDLCGQTFCSKCVPRQSCFIPFAGPRICTICLVITNPRTTHDQLALIRVKHLRAYVLHSKIASLNRLESCFEKQDLINLIQPKKNQTSNNNATTTTSNVIHHQEVQRPRTNTNEQTSIPNVSSSVLTNDSQRQTIPESVPQKPAYNRVTLDIVSSVESINDLTVRQLKDILTQNFVTITGCVEKQELINKVELLYRDKQHQCESKATNDSQSSDENLCKICMDANIDCVFLDCGHLCTCVRCGKQLSECPLCRSYIVRVVRVFKG